ncbi:MAG: hypothetical protein QM628_15675 [Propionicimonas sp.]
MKKQPSTPYRTALTALRRQPPDTPPVNRVFGAAQTVRSHHPDVTARQAINAIRAASEHLRLTKLTALLDKPGFRVKVARQVWGNRRAQPGTLGAAANQVKVARCLVAWVAEPGDGLTPAKARKVRVVTAWIGARIFETDGWDTTKFTGNRMATELGLGKAPTARAWLRLAAARGVQPAGRQAAVTIRQQPKDGSGLVLALRQLGHPQREALLDLTDVVDDLAAVAAFGIKGHTLPVSAALLSVAHPLWTHSGVVGVADWDCLVQYLLRLRGGTYCVDGRPKPVPVATQRVLARLRKLGIEPDATSADLLASIDSAAGRLNAYERKRAAEEAAAAATRQRMKEVARARRLKPIEAAIMADCPDGTDAAPALDVARRQQWAEAGRAVALQLPVDALPHLQQRLVKAFVGAGWPEDRAGRVAGAICAPPEPPVAGAA